MKVLFIILTAIGILLLLVLLLAAFGLFCPVSYRLKGEAEEKASFFFRFGWLFGLLWFEFVLKSPAPEIRLGIFRWKKNFGIKETEEENIQKAAIQRTTEQETAIPKETAQETKTPEQTAPDAPEADRHAEAFSGKKSRARPKRRGSRRKRAKEAQDKETARARTWKEKYAGFKAEVSDEKNHRAIRHLWQELTYIALRLKPKYIKGEIYFATGDPALTGMATGALSLFPVSYRYDARVYPDFAADTPYIRGTIALGGKMSPYHMVRGFIRIVRNKNTMQFIRKFR